MADDLAVGRLTVVDGADILAGDVTLLAGSLRVLVGGVEAADGTSTFTAARIGYLAALPDDEPLQVAGRLLVGQPFAGSGVVGGDVQTFATSGHAAVEGTLRCDLLKAQTAIQVAGVQVVGPQTVGWVAADEAETGRARAGFVPSTVTTANLAKVLAALIDDLGAHGLLDVVAYGETPSGAPEGLGVPANWSVTVSANVAAFAWLAVAGATGYDVEVEPTGGGDGSSQSTVELGLTVALASGTEYQARVRAVDATTSGAWSDWETFTTGVASSWFDWQWTDYGFSLGDFSWSLNLGGYNFYNSGPSTKNPYG
ncbi:MAG: fibronectin type III domain-containing protein [Acidimicrobiales bacterium]|nr:fibronectin type III domain-containing protein [Acidimicrobiales bacterium]